MDLTQSKLSKIEWDNIEIPVSEKEKKILESPKAEEYMKLKLEHQEAIEAREAMRKEYSEKCALVNSKEQELAKF